MSGESSWSVLALMVSAFRSKSDTPRGVDARMRVCIASRRHSLATGSPPIVACVPLGKRMDFNVVSVAKQHESCR